MANRVNNSSKNIATGILGQFLYVLFQFLGRTIFIHVLSTEYLGLNGLFSNILSVLSLTEMGFGTALLYSLYKPLNDHDEKTICQLMQLFKRVYQVVAAVILMFGLLLIPFLPYLIQDIPDFPNLTLYYILYLINTVSSYLFIYKRSIIEANQQSYITNIYQKAISILQAILQIIFLLITRNYTIYLIWMILANIVTNILLSKKADKLFPYLRERIKEPLSKKEVHAIVKNTYALFLHRIGGVVVNSTDNLVISKFIGLVSVGFYSNYLLITTNISNFTSLIFNSVTASLGNLSVSQDKDRVYDIFNELLFMAFWIYGFCAVAMFLLFNPFIQLWIGDGYCFSANIVFVIVVNFYLNGTRILMRVFRDAFGLFWYFRYKSIFEALVNLLFSLVLVCKIGLIGVLIGTTISTMTVAFWIEPYVLYKHVFHKGTIGYFIKYGEYCLILSVTGAILYFFVSLMPEGFVGFVMKVIIVCVGFNVIVAAITFRNPYFKKLLERLAPFVNKFLKRSHK